MAYWQFHYPKRFSFYPPDLDDRGLGGSEAVLVLVTRQLALRGHRIEVFNCCYKPGEYDGVRWRMVWELGDAPTADVTVAVRFDEAIWRGTREPARRLFWMLDDRVSGPAVFADEFPDGVIVVASNAMRQRLDASGVLAPIVMIPHPVDVKSYDPHLQRVRACLYSSMPNRGLDQLLRFWPRIHMKVPDSELWVTSGWQLWGFTNSEANDRWHQLLGDTPLPEGARIFGPMPRARLHWVQEQAWLGLYPCRFPEMFCLVAAECAAAATPMVTSSIGALTERVVHGETGILIPGSIDEEVVQERFVEETIMLLLDPDRQNRLGGAARVHAAQYDIDLVAQQWETLALQTS